MKMIDVLNLIAEGKIKNDTKLIVSTDLDDYEYRYSKGYNTFFNKHSNRIEDDFLLDKDFLNFEAKLIEPKPKKYRLKLYKYDNLSYINKNAYSSYVVANKSERTGYKTKFTQEEIDGSMFLKFIEQYGVKEEIEDNEID